MNILTQVFCAFCFAIGLISVSCASDDDADIYEFTCSQSPYNSYVQVLNRHLTIPDDFELTERDNKSITMKESALANEDTVVQFVRKIQITFGQEFSQSTSEWNTIEPDHYVAAEYDIRQTVERVDDKYSAHKTIMYDDDQYLLVAGVVPINVESLLDCMVIQ